MSNKVRLRFAPSPTGPLHIGGLRTALYNYLVAKKLKGKLILRIEDTDYSRFDKNAEKHIVDSLKWCGIIPDESPYNPGKYGPYNQSGRKNIYKNYVDELVKKGFAYYAFDKKSELEDLRIKSEQKGKNFIYNWKNRKKLKNSISLKKEELKTLINNGDYVIRFKTVKSGNEKNYYHIKDQLRGTIKIDLNILDDKIIFKSDGMPTYHFANVIDDYLMKISHVIRGEEWLPSLPLHFLLYDAFEWEKPSFTHLPLILKPSGAGKLSKRDGHKFGIPIYPIEWLDLKENDSYLGFKEMGFEPHALLNFICMIGWNPGDEREIFSIKKLIEVFSFQKINKSGGKYDFEKAKWFNQNYVKKISNTVFLDIISKNINDNLLKFINRKKKILLIKLLKERITFKNDIISEINNILNFQTQDLDKTFIQNKWNTKISHAVNSIKEKIKNSTITNERLKKYYFQVLKNQKIKIGEGMQALRLCITSKTYGPDLFEIINILGKRECLKRIDKSLKIIND